jgi:hypothetical protein
VTWRTQALSVALDGGFIVIDHRHVLPVNQDDARADRVDADPVADAIEAGSLPSNRLATILTPLGVTVTAIATLGGLLGWLGWTNGQWIVVGAAAGAFLGLVISLVAHLRKSTRGEPVAVGAPATAFATALATLGGAFDLWSTRPDVQAAGRGPGDSRRWPHLGNLRSRKRQPCPGAEALGVRSINGVSLPLITTRQPAW